MQRWSPEQAWTWHNAQSVVRGCNYVPRSAVNSTEMWQAETFDPHTIDQELGWAANAGYNAVRVFLQYLVWQASPVGQRERLDAFLNIADGHGMGTMPVLFCDCSFSGREPYLGPQDAPAPGVHNSGWVPSPGLQRVTDRAAWPNLEPYVQDIIHRFGRDRRVLAWDLYNEPGNSGMDERSLPLVEAAFTWARAAQPDQPLTTGLWRELNSPMSERIAALSDVISFHAYDPPEGVEAKIQHLAHYGRPLICSEWLHRQTGNTFDAILPLFASHRVGWFHWGLVAGRTQTYMPWGSAPGDPMPRMWQHDVFYPDGAPYDPAELERVRRFSFSSRETG